MLRHCNVLDRRIGTYNHPTLVRTHSSLALTVFVLATDVMRQEPKAGQVEANAGTAGNPNPRLSTTPKLRERPVGLCAAGLFEFRRGLARRR